MCQSPVCELCLNLSNGLFSGAIWCEHADSRDRVLFYSQYGHGSPPPTINHVEQNTHSQQFFSIRRESCLIKRYFDTVSNTIKSQIPSLIKMRQMKKCQLAFTI